MLRNQIPLNSSEGRKISTVILVLSILFALFGLYRSAEFDRRVEAGELVELQATIQSITVTCKGEDRKFDVRVCYSFCGTRYDNVKLSWYSSEMKESPSTTIYVSPADPDVPVTDSVRLFRIAFYSFPAVALLCFTLARLPRKRAG